LYLAHPRQLRLFERAAQAIPGQLAQLGDSEPDLKSIRRRKSKLKAKRMKLRSQVSATIVIIPLE